jgi:tetratricopeptide (TPR) repeat protein
VRRRRLLSIALGVTLALVAVEVALQVVAFVIWAGRSEAGADIQAAVLCVGDSFTYGLGATGDGGSYPRQLEQRLAANGDARTVINGAWPGQTSREVLLRLPEQLRRHRPDVVCVLVGINDISARPARVVEADFEQPPPTGFPLRLRVAQVFSLMVTWLTHEHSATPALVGTWHHGDLEVTFEPSGRVVLGKDELRWIRDERGFALVMPKGEVQPLSWSIAEGQLHLRTPEFEHTLAAGPAPPPRALVLGERALARGEFALAKGLFEAALPTGEDAPSARAGLLAVALAEGDRPRAVRLRDELQAHYATDASVGVGGALLRAHVALGEAEPALELAERILAREPTHLPAWDVMLASAATQLPRVLAYMQRVLAAAPADASWRPLLLQTRATLLRPSDPVAALDDLFTAFLLTGDGAFLQRQCELGAADYTLPARDAALGRLLPEAAARVRAALAADVGAAGVYSTLRAHLEHVAVVCKAHRAQLWLLSYPEPDAQRDALVAGVAAAVGARFVALHPRFTELLAATPRPQLFIPDGHCTDRGYGVMADELAKLLR